MTSEVYDFNNEADKSEARRYPTQIEVLVEQGITSFNELKTKIFEGSNKPGENNLETWRIDDLFNRGLIMVNYKIYKVDYPNKQVTKN